MVESTASDQLNRDLDALRQSAPKWAGQSTADRIEILRRCLDGVADNSKEWVNAACDAKGIAVENPLRAEEIAAGPVAAARFLKLLINNLEHLQSKGSPYLPGKMQEGPGGRVRVPVQPDAKLYDPLTFSGFKANVWLEKGISKDRASAKIAAKYRGSNGRSGSVCAVLGAGNVSSIPPTDALSKLFLEDACVLLKMNPVNEYLGPIFEKAFEALIEPGFLRIVYGGGEVGAQMVQDHRVDSVHITGSIHTHDTIVWGSPGPERDRRKSENDPIFKKPITSELGNVTPWILVPGPYSEKQLAFQAENVAASIVNNASFNCIATKVIVTWKGWADRGRFLDLVESNLRKTPPRKAYYPGAFERFRTFAPSSRAAGEDGTLPWTLIRDMEPQAASSQYFCEESFVCVCVEVGLEAEDEKAFLDKAVDFANENLWGTLGASITVHPRTRKGHLDKSFDEAIGRLRYGTIGVNHWTGVAFAIMGIPWGGYPGATLADAQSGIGFVHNAYMLENVEKSVFEGPLTVFPKPIWFPSHTKPEPVAWNLLNLYEKPSLPRLLKLIGSSLF
jgi:acyl-CoA reductase-like NAD-dependent aldehyde dehydrogenase